jgi:hypothetical protein
VRGDVVLPAGGFEIAPLELVRGFIVFGMSRMKVSWSQSRLRWSRHGGRLSKASKEGACSTNKRNNESEQENDQKDMNERVGGWMSDGSVSGDDAGKER